jgi:hypothetical protein
MWCTKEVVAARRFSNLHLTSKIIKLRRIFCLFQSNSSITYFFKSPYTIAKSGNGFMCLFVARNPIAFE